jgi:hypothetical protein
LPTFTFNISEEFQNENKVLHGPDLPEIPLDPPFSKGENHISSGSMKIGSPPFEKGRPGGISGKAFSDR